MTKAPNFNFAGKSNDGRLLSTVYDENDNVVFQFSAHSIPYNLAWRVHEIIKDIHENGNNFTDRHTEINEFLMNEQLKQPRKSAML